MSIRAPLRHYYGREWREVHRPAALERARVTREQAASALLAAGVAAKSAEYGVAARRVLAHPEAHVHRCACTGECGHAHEERCPEVDRFPAVSFAGAVVLTVAHLNQEPWDMREENLRALCQACHNRLDASARARNRAVTREEQLAKAEAASPQATLWPRPARVVPRRTWDVPPR